MTRDQIITLVKTKMDEITGFSSSEIDAVSLIDPLLDEASDKIRRMVPLHLIHPVEFDISGLVMMDPVLNEIIGNDDEEEIATLNPEFVLDKTKKGGYIPLPSDFLRLHSFQMKEWKTMLTGDDVTDASSVKYKKQKFAYIRGGPWKPVIAIVHRIVPKTQLNPGDIAGKVLEFYSIYKSTECPIHFYVHSVAAEVNEEILIEPLSYQCAADALGASNDFESAQAAQAKVIQFVQENTVRQ